MFSRAKDIKRSNYFYVWSIGKNKNYKMPFENSFQRKRKWHLHQYNNKLAVFWLSRWHQYKRLLAATYAGKGGYQQPCPQSFSCVIGPALKELSVKFCKLLRFGNRTNIFSVLCFTLGGIKLIFPTCMDNFAIQNAVLQIKNIILISLIRS